MRIVQGLGLVVLGVMTLGACTVTTSTGDGNDAGGAPAATPGDDAGTPAPHDDGGVSTTDGSAPPTGSPGHAPSNLPPGTTLGATGDWVFNSDTCGGTKVTIDTAKGTVECSGQPDGAFTYQAITQADTSLGTLPAALFVTRNLTIEPNMEVTVRGNRPLVIVALETARIQGTLRAGADRNSPEKAAGGGFDGPTNDTKGSGPGGGAAPSGTSAAGGGAFCGKGGAGTDSNGSDVAGGKAYGAPTNVPLVGGSSGGSGNYGLGGAGGGAIQISAGTSIEISAVGTIDVGGGGGNWARSGGGAGGAILLEAPTVSVLGTLAANGGGGAEGGITNRGESGSASAAAAKGGIGTNGNASGGAGAAGTVEDGLAGAKPAAVNDKAGAGGGGAGRIRINTQSGAATIGATAVISPALTTSCATQGTLTH